MTSTMICLGEELTGGTHITAELYDKWGSVEEKPLARYPLAGDMVSFDIERDIDDASLNILVEGIIYTVSHLHIYMQQGDRLDVTF